MKRLVFAMLAVAILLIPSVAAAKDAGPAAPAKVEVKKDAAATPASAPAKPEIKIEGKVEVSAKETKLTPAAPAASDEFDVAKVIVGIWTSFKEGRVYDGVALLLMLLTFLVGLVRKDIPPAALPWIAAGIGIATNIVSALMGGVEWSGALTSGLFQGAAAAGFWSMIGKHVLRGKEERQKRAKARELSSNGVVSGETGK